MLFCFTFVVRAANGPCATYFCSLGMSAPPVVGGYVGSNAKRKVERKAAKPGEAGAPDSNVGQALRSVYDEAVGEDIPREMLDLLGKLK